MEGRAREPVYPRSRYGQDRARPRQAEGRLEGHRAQEVACPGVDADEDDTQEDRDGEASREDSQGPQVDGQVDGQGVESQEGDCDHTEGQVGSDEAKRQEVKEHRRFEGPPSHPVYLIGPSSVGKSYLAEAVALELGVKSRDSDHELKEPGLREWSKVRAWLDGLDGTAVIVDIGAGTQDAESGQFPAAGPESKSGASAFQTSFEIDSMVWSP